MVPSWTSSATSAGAGVRNPSAKAPIWWPNWAFNLPGACRKTSCPRASTFWPTPTTRGRAKPRPGATRRCRPANWNTSMPMSGVGWSARPASWAQWYRITTMTVFPWPPATTGWWNACATSGVSGGISYRTARRWSISTPSIGPHRPRKKRPRSPSSAA